MARTRDRFELSCYPTITTALYSVSANSIKEVADMNSEEEEVRWMILKPWRILRSGWILKTKKIILMIALCED